MHAARAYHSVIFLGMVSISVLRSGFTQGLGAIGFKGLG